MRKVYMELIMNKLEKIEAAKKQLMLERECTEDIFNLTGNIIIKSDKSFFEMLTFGNNAAIRVNEKLYKWSKDILQNKEAKRIMDGDILSNYRKSGLATYLVKALAEEIENREKIAYYTTCGGNIPSTKVALNVGFYPIWVSYHAESVNS